MPPSSPENNEVPAVQPASAQPVPAQNVDSQVGANPPPTQLPEPTPGAIIAGSFETPGGQMSISSPGSFDGPKKSKLPMIIVAAVVSIVIIVGAVLGLVVFKGSSSDSVANCGSINVTNATFNKSPFGGCFNQHFASCSPAEITVNDQTTFESGTVNEYKIKSKQGTSCLVEWQYVKLPANTSWQGKEITCPYTIGSDFEAAFSKNSDFNGCSGPLLTIMDAGSTSNSSSSQPAQTNSGSNTTTQTNGSGSSTTNSNGSTFTGGSGTTVIQNSTH